MLSGGSLKINMDEIRKYVSKYNVLAYINPTHFKKVTLVIISKMTSIFFLLVNGDDDDVVVTVTL